MTNQEKPIVEVIRFKKELSLALNCWYIGRRWKKGDIELNQSPLANPYVVKKDDSNRKEAIELYKKWLWEQMKLGIKGNKNLAWEELLKIIDYHRYFGSTVFLMCWCKPKDCHGDVIKKAIEWMIEQGF